MSDSNNIDEVSYKNRHVSRFIGVLSVYSCLLKNDNLKDLTKISKRMTVSYLTKDVFDFELSDTQIDEMKLVTPDLGFLDDLMKLILDKEPEVDQLIKQSLNTKWNFDRLDKVIKSILKLAGAELLFNGEIAANIIIDEYVSLTKTFYENNEAGFINKVLDVAAVNARGQEDNS